MKIQERDKAIIQSCYQQQFLLIEHVERYFFQGAASQNARLRIQQLERAGWLRKESIATLGTRRIIRLTPKGVAFARDLTPHVTPQTLRLNHNTFSHDALVTSVALRLQELWDGEWIPEGALDRRDFRNVPDGIFVFESGKRAAIEVENTLKGRNRFLTILKGWRTEDVVFVLYVATQPDVHRGLKSYLAEGVKHLPFGLVNWNELSAGMPFPWSAHGELDLFNRRTF